MIRNVWQFVYQGRRVGFGRNFLDKRTAIRAFKDQVVREGEYCAIWLQPMEVRDGYYQRKSKPG